MKLRMSASMHTLNLEVRDQTFLLFGLNSPHAEVWVRVFNELQTFSPFYTFQRNLDVHLRMSEARLYRVCVLKWYFIVFRAAEMSVKKAHWTT